MMLNSAPRARSLVGRTVSPGGANRRRPRGLPATMRTYAGRMRLAAHGFAVGCGGLGVAASELLRQHLLRYLRNCAAGQIAELERPIGEADQARHLEPQMFEHPAHLAGFPFPQRHRDPGVAALPAFEARADRAVGYAVDGGALFEGGEPL